MTYRSPLVLICLTRGQYINLRDRLPADGGNSSLNHVVFGR
jgi:hypothetical protein